MIKDGRDPGKPLWEKFAAPPWTRQSSEWLSADGQLEDDHLARQVDRGVDLLDLTPLLRTYAGHGSQPHRPDLMLKIAIFEIQRGRSSPAHWHLDTKENVALWWLGQGIRPSRSVWYEFAARLRRHLDRWNQEVLRLAQQRQHTRAERGSLDGTFVEAHASRHRLLHNEQLGRRLQKLQEAVDADLRESPWQELPYWMAKTPATRRRQRRQYLFAQEKLAARLEENRRRIPSLRLEEKHVRVSVSDPEAALGKDKHNVYRPLYNVQYVRDLDSQFILGYEVFASNTDAATLEPMLRRTQQMTGRVPEVATADSGYLSALDLAVAEQWSVDLVGPWRENDYSQKAAGKAKDKAVKPLDKDQFLWEDEPGRYRCPQGQPLERRSTSNRRRSGDRFEKITLYQAEAATCAACTEKERCCPKSKSGRHVSRSEHEELIDAHRAKMQQPQYKELYKRRRQTVEQSFADSKEHRHFRRVNGRGLWRARFQAAVTVLAHNVVELVKAAVA